MEYKSKTAKLLYQRMRGENNYRDAIPLLKELNDNGFDISDFNELTLNVHKYKDALPILLKWIPRINNPDVAETIVRAVSVPWAKKRAVPTLIEKLETERESGNDSLTWALGNALYAVSDKSYAEELLNIIKDPIYKSARQMIILKIGMMHIKTAEDILISIIDDEEVRGHTIAALGYIGSIKAKPYITEYLDHPNKWIQKEAKNALERINKANSKS
jgi:hypothetical protein